MGEIWPLQNEDTRLSTKQDEDTRLSTSHKQNYVTNFSEICQHENCIFHLFLYSHNLWY